MGRHTALKRAVADERCRGGTVSEVNIEWVVMWAVINLIVGGGEQTGVAGRKVVGGGRNRKTQTEGGGERSRERMSERASIRDLGKERGLISPLLHSCRGL